MSSVRQIAKQAGVSITTVSRVLNNHPRVSTQARDKVLAAANANRYQPTVGRKSTVNIALLYTGPVEVGSTFDAALMEGMASGMKEFNYDLMVLDGPRVRLPHESYSQMFLRKGIRGAILRCTGESRDPARQIADEGFPSVVLGDYFEHPTAHFVRADSVEASKQAIQHLLDLGHTRIGLVTNDQDDCDHLDRLAGYRLALDEAGIAYDPTLVYRSPAHRVGGETFMNRFVTMANRPTALYFLDPISGFSAINQAQTLGLRVPEDLSIVGFDDFEWRFMARPQITAVCQDAIAIGQAAFRALNQLIEAPQHHRQFDVKPAWLEVHHSTGPVPSD